MERITARLLVSVLLTALLALILAEVGWFSYGGLLVAVLMVCGASMLVRPPQDSARQPIQRFGRFDLGLAAIALVFGVLVARPFEVVRGGLDAGVYANTGVSIARTGAVVVHDQVVQEIGERAIEGDTTALQIASNVFGVQNSQRFEATRLRAAGFFISTGDLEHGRVVPQFFHLWPAFIAVWVTMLGSVYGLAATGIAGTLGVVLTGLIGRRIAGSAAGLLAAAYLAAMSPQVWFSRMPTSEALTQALLLGGCWAFTHFADATERRQRIWWGGIVGLCFGQLALTRIDFPLAIAPLILLLAYVALSRRWHIGYTAMTGVLALLLLHSALHIIFIARAYFIDTTIPTLQKYALTITLSWPLLTPELQEYSAGRPGSMVGNWQRLALEITALVVLISAALLLRQWSGLLRNLEARIQRWRQPLLGLIVATLGLLAVYGYFIRPGILDRTILSAPLAPEHWLRLQGYIGAPIAIPFDQYPSKPVIAVAQANMVRLGWYLSPLGIVLGVVGGLRLWWRIDRRFWLLLAISTIYTLFFVQSLYGTRDQTYIYILRRYVPIVFPAFVLGIVYALDWLRRDEQPRATQPTFGARPAMRRTIPSGANGIALHVPWFTFQAMRRTASGMLAAVLLLFFVVTGRTVYAHTEYAGMLAQLHDLSAAIGPDDIVLLRGGGASDIAVRDTSELIAAPLTYIYGRNAFPVKGRTPAKYPCLVR